MERLLFFSDAVFAIAITLLALDIRLPVEPDTLSSSELLTNIVGIWPKYMGWPAIFLVSIDIAFINDDWARWFWVLILPVSIFVR